jgi:hypothetical protein
MCYAETRTTKREDREEAIVSLICDGEEDWSQIRRQQKNHRPLTIVSPRYNQRVQPPPPPKKKRFKNVAPTGTKMSHENNCAIEF